ncbi:coiled-coil domain-containing protein [Acinetobacter towneri]|uniref:Uncharacterized protein n=1 Tax=Acinetobacter towneri TaxID=202956 RepID=A0AAP9GW33_9GAMM|nr:hypothetical protein [Acinetobacter towneri]QGM28372.1 hypothetical protein GJD93_12120 [Acinetobacter towneri]
MKKKEISFKFSAVALAVLLAGCGGGGSDGYYNNGSSSTESGGSINNGGSNAVETNYHLIINASKPQLVVTGDTAVITVKLADVNGGGVSGESVVLAVEDTINNGVTIEGSSNVKSDENGNAIFTIRLTPSNVKNISELLRDGIRLNAIYKDAAGKLTSQTRILEVVDSVQSSNIAQYHLDIAVNKPTLVVTGDNAIVTVKAIDENGGGVSGREVTLSIVDTKTNKVTINGSSVGITDSNGNIKYNITLPTVPDSLVSNIIDSGITLDAKIVDGNQVVSKQSIKINVSKGVIEQPIGNITFGKSGELAKTADALYYREALSAHVVDIDGKPLPNYRVTMSIDLLRAGRGYFQTKAQLDGTRNIRLNPLRANLNTQNSNLRQQESLLASIQGEPVQSAEITRLQNEIATVEQQIRDQRSLLAKAQTNLELAQNRKNEPFIQQYQAEIISINGEIAQLNLRLEGLRVKLTTAIASATAEKQQRINQQTNIVNDLKNQTQTIADAIKSIESLVLPSRVQSYCEIVDKSNVQLATGFVDPQGNVSPTFTYTTDSTGKFNFSVQYLRQYAGWQTVEFKAKTSVSTKDLNSSLVYGLGLLKEDFDSEAGQPFDESPYGQNCALNDPFAGLLP